MADNTKSVVLTAAEIGKAVAMLAASKLGLELADGWAAEQEWRRSDTEFSVRVTFVPATEEERAAARARPADA